jgi:hypothetical protein
VIQLRSDFASWGNGIFLKRPQGSNSNFGLTEGLILSTAQAPFATLKKQALCTSEWAQFVGSHSGHDSRFFRVTV